MARPSISSAIKREVRQRCGFGCVICGCPIYEYDHLLGWAETRRHKASELTLLCPQHHGEKTKGLIPARLVRSANQNPYNKKSATTKPQTLYNDGEEICLVLGGSTFTYPRLEEGQTFFPFTIDGRPVVSFTKLDGAITLDAEIHDQEGKVCLKIVNGELTINTHMWDVEWVGKKLTIRQDLSDVILRIEFSQSGRIDISRASLCYKGIELEIGENYIYCLNNQSIISQCNVFGAGYAFAIGEPVPPGCAGIVVTGISRSVPDRGLALRHLREIKRKLGDAQAKALPIKIDRPSQNRYTASRRTRARLLSGVSRLIF